MKKSLIVACSSNNVIGKENDLPWHLPEDLKHFKKLTTGHHIIMGRKTFESIGKPLRNRTSVVLSRNDMYFPKGAISAISIEEALTFAEQNLEEEAFIIGGGQIYQQAIDLVDTLYVTRIHKEIEGDTFFPLIDETKWKKVASIDKEGKEFDYSFETYQKS